MNCISLVLPLWVSRFLAFFMPREGLKQSSIVLEGFLFYFFVWACLLHLSLRTLSLLRNQSFSLKKENLRQDFDLLLRLTFLLLPPDANSLHQMPDRFVLGNCCVDLRLLLLCSCQFCVNRNIRNSGISIPLRNEYSILWCHMKLWEVFRQDWIHRVPTLREKLLLWREKLIILTHTWRRLELHYFCENPEEN